MPEQDVHGYLLRHRDEQGPLQVVQRERLQVSPGAVGLGGGLHRARLAAANQLEYRVFLKKIIAELSYIVTNNNNNNLYSMAS